MIDAFLFDFGGVFTPSPFDAYGDAERVRQVEVIFGPYDRDTEHPWHRLERGEISMKTARKLLIDLGKSEGVNADPFEYFGAMRTNDAFEVREPFVECVRAVRRTARKTALVTNNVAEFRERWRKRIPVDELFDAVVDSSEVGMRKPDPGIYLHTLGLLGDIAPERAVFIDDYHGNITAAEALGMRGVLVEDDPSGALRELGALIGA